MRRWVARFTFTFVALAAVLAWEGRRVARGERPSRAAPVVWYAGAAACVALAAFSLRERHRPADVKDRDRADARDDAPRP